MDSYGVIYNSVWSTTASGFDITTTIKQPRVWGEANQGYKQGHALFRRGLVSVDRQIIAVGTDGYTIVAEGGQQDVQFFQSSFPCGPKPTDPFCYHFNNWATDEAEENVVCGPRWTDPDEDNDVVWGDVADSDGTVTTSSPELFQWVDVWGNDEELVGTCQD